MENEAVEDLGETGPIQRSPIDLKTVPRSSLSPLTRVALAQAAIAAVGLLPVPSRRDNYAWGALRRLSSAPTSIPPKGSGGRVKRNATCPCGSGRKFGKCCLPKMKK